MIQRDAELIRPRGRGFLNLWGAHHQVPIDGQKCQDTHIGNIIFTLGGIKIVLRLH